MTLVYAHRGASTQERENTIAAFAAAVVMGADGVELDARRTVDGAIAVHHDAHLGDGRPVIGLVATDLPDHVPLLGAALDACGDLVVNIEIKNWPDDVDFDRTELVAEAVVAEVGARRSHDAVLVSSFHLPTIERVYALDPAIPTGLLVVLAPDDDFGALVDRCGRGGHAALHPHHSGVTDELVDLCHRAGLALNTWTVDDPLSIARLAGMGVDGIVTNVPDVALVALGR